MKQSRQKSPGGNVKNAVALVMISYLLAPAAPAEVEPCIVVLLTSGGGFPIEYTIPTGKVFIIEAVRNLGHTSGPTQANISYGATHPVAVGSLGWTFDVSTDFISDDPAFVQGKFRLPAEAKLKVPTNGAFQATYMGLLVDQADLYAAQIPADLSDPRIEGLTLVADARFRSPRPRIVWAQSTENLDQFEDDPSGQVTRKTDPSVDVVAVDANAEKKFLRAEAVARSQ